MGSLVGMIVHMISYIHHQQDVVQNMMVLVEDFAGMALGVGGRGPRVSSSDPTLC